MQNQTIKELFSKHPYLVDFFNMLTLDITGHEDECIEEFFYKNSTALYESHSLTKEQFLNDLFEYIKAMESFLGIEQKNVLHSISIVAGRDKSGEKEKFEKITIHPSEIIAIVGPTGSGKSRLLADIEWTANRDTQTKRQILINDAIPDTSWRYSVTNKLVAQLSQNMNFVIDVTVYEFLQMHAECKTVGNVEEIIVKIIEEANRLSGEKFSKDTNVTALSGGQSRALMIADTAILSACPIVLIDEIENAGIDRKKALDLLLSEDKIVLMATHDPLLCLMADKRIVIENGGIKDVLVTSDEEKELLSQLWKMDATLTNIRTQLRSGSRAGLIELEIIG